jgi:hypothetical protein
MPCGQPSEFRRGETAGSKPRASYRLPQCDEYQAAGFFHVRHVLEKYVVRDSHDFDHFVPVACARMASSALRIVLFPSSCKSLLWASHSRPCLHGALPIDGCFFVRPRDLTQL